MTRIFFFYCKLMEKLHTIFVFQDCERILKEEVAAALGNQEADGEIAAADAAALRGAVASASSGDGAVSCGAVASACVLAPKTDRGASLLQQPLR